MGGSTKPTAEAGKAVALRHALLALQKEHASTGRKFAALAGVPSGTWSRYTTGQQKPSEDMVNKICDNLDVNGEQRANLLSYLHGTDEQQWVAMTLPEQRAMLAAYLDIEDSAIDITEWAPLMVPGLGQIRAYTERIMTRGDVPRQELLTRVNVRIGRRDVLTRKNPATYRAFLGEAVLCQVVGSRSLMADQLRYLLHLAKQPNVEIRVVPFDSDFHPGLEGDFVRLNTRDGPIVHVELQGTGLFLTGPDAKPYDAKFDAVAALALEQEPSLRLITEHAERMERSA